MNLTLTKDVSLKVFHVPRSYFPNTLLSL